MSIGKSPPRPRESLLPWSKQSRGHRCSGNGLVDVLARASGTGRERLPGRRIGHLVLRLGLHELAWRSKRSAARREKGSDNFSPKPVCFWPPSQAPITHPSKRGGLGSGGSDSVRGNAEPAASRIELGEG